MFADVSGFTAWASARQPAEVFTFLEQTYSVFDGLAKKRKIFKVETVGDSYVAATGVCETLSLRVMLTCFLCLSQPSLNL